MSQAPVTDVVPGSARVNATSLKESILFAFDRDPSVSQQAAQMGIGQAQVDEALSGWKPQIGFNGNLGHSQTTDSSGSLRNSAAWGISLTQLVYDFGKTSYGVSQAELQHESYRYQLMVTLSTVAEKTALSYVEVLRYGELVRAAQENIRILNKVAKLATLRAEGGLSSTSDTLQTRSKIAGMQSTLAQYQAALRSAQAKLAVLTGVNAQKLAPPALALAMDNQAMNQIDYSQIPSVLAARAMESSAQRGIERAKSQHWPTLSIKAGRTRYESDSRAYWDDQVQLNVDGSLYQGGAISARVRQAEGARAMAASQVEQARFDIQQKSALSLAEWSGARQRLSVGKLQIKNALQTRSVYEDEYTLSKRSINDLLSVEQDVWQATSSKIIAEHDSWSSAISYAAAIDTLLPAVGIKKTATARLPDLK